jgi:hypothetical protein
VKRWLMPEFVGQPCDKGERPGYYVKEIKIKRCYGHLVAMKYLIILRGPAGSEKSTVCTYLPTRSMLCKEILAKLRSSKYTHDFLMVEMMKKWDDFKNSLWI